jgi:hypothetical protein
MSRLTTILLMLLALLLVLLAAAPARGAEVSGTAESSGKRDLSGRSLTLQDAIVMALERNEGIVIEREGLTSARADWRRATEPVNSTFSGAPAGEAAPTVESSGAGVSVSSSCPRAGR